MSDLAHASGKSVLFAPINSPGSLTDFGMSISLTFIQTIVMMWESVNYAFWLDTASGTVQCRGHILYPPPPHVHPPPPPLQV